jgi:hypothetical protein
MVVLVTDQAPSSRLTSLAAAVAAAVPEVVSVVSLLEPGERVDDEQEGGEQQLLWGAERLRMHLAGVELDVSAKSFFQTNTAQGNTLVQVRGYLRRDKGLLDKGNGIGGWIPSKITPFLLNHLLFNHSNFPHVGPFTRCVQVMAEACGLKGDGSEVVLDLYCGVGLLGIALAHRCREVWGVELEEAAVADATHNAVLNRLTNCTFFQVPYSDGKVANRNVRVGDELTRRLSRRPTKSLSRIVARTHMYTYAAKYWALSIDQGWASLSSASLPGGSSHTHSAWRRVRAQGDLGKVAASLGKRIPRPDVVVVDPNRAGCPPSLTAFLRRAAAPTVVRLSISPLDCRSCGITLLKKATSARTVMRK